MDFSFKVTCTFCILPCLLANGKVIVVISIMGSDVGLHPMDELCFSTYPWKVCIFKYKPRPLVRNLLNIQLRKQFYCRWNKHFLKTCYRRQPTILCEVIRWNKGQADSCRHGLLSRCPLCLVGDWGSWGQRWQTMHYYSALVSPDFR